MGELGKEEVEMHREVGVYAVSKNLDLLICMGELSQYMAEAAKHAAPTKPIFHFKTKEELLQELPQILQKGDTVLVKASHFMGFEDVVKELEKNKIDW